MKRKLLGAARAGGLFIVVGLTAALVHALVVWALVAATAMSPLIANVGGFLVAFWVSYFGHRYLSFTHGRHSPWRRALPRFALVAVLAFSANELFYAALLTFTPLPYMPALVLVLGTVAVGTYILSRFWAFSPE